MQRCDRLGAAFIGKLVEIDCEQRRRRPDADRALVMRIDLQNLGWNDVPPAMVLETGHAASLVLATVKAGAVGRVKLSA